MEAKTKQRLWVSMTHFHSVRQWLHDLVLIHKEQAWKPGIQEKPVSSHAPGKTLQHYDPYICCIVNSINRSCCSWIPISSLTWDNGALQWSRFIGYTPSAGFRDVLWIWLRLNVKVLAVFCFGDIEFLVNIFEFGLLWRFIVISGVSRYDLCVGFLDSCFDFFIVVDWELYLRWHSCLTLQLSFSDPCPYCPYLYPITFFK